MSRAFALVLAASAALVGACNLVAGLDQFHPATDAAASTSGAGGAGSTTDVASSGSPSSGPTMTSGPGPTTTSGSGACATHVLLNEVRLHDDFVELFNPTTSTVDVSELRIYALASGGSFNKKWDGLGTGKTLKPGGYFLIVGMAGNFTNEDEVFSNGISDTQTPTVVLVTDQSDTVIDSVCVCSNPPCMEAFGVEVCVGRWLDAPAFQDDLGDGVSRQGCGDTDDDNADFLVACPTPKAQNGTLACP